MKKHDTSISKRNGFPTKRIIDVIFQKYAEGLRTDAVDIKDIERDIAQTLVDFSQRTRLKVKALKITPVGDGKYQLVMEVE